MSGVWPADQPIPQDTAWMSSEPMRRLICYPQNGLGNRLRVAVSCVMSAMLRGQVVQLYWVPGDNHGAYYRDLFESSDHLDLEYSLNSFRIPLQLGLSSLYYKYLNVREYDAQSAEGVQDIQVPLHDWSMFFSERIFCDEYQKSFYDFIYDYFTYRVEWIRSDQYFGHLVKKNRLFQKWIEQAVPDGQMFSRIGAKIFVPKRNVLDKLNSIQAIYEERKSLIGASETVTILRNESDMILGLQIRKFSEHPSVEPFISCLSYWISRQIYLKSLHLILVTDSSKVYESVNNEIERKDKNWPVKLKLTFNKDIIPREETRTLDVNDAQVALLDMLLLSACDVVLLTSESTFGSSSAIWRPRYNNSIPESWVVWNQAQQKFFNEGLEKIKRDGLSYDSWPALSGACASLGTAEPFYATHYKVRSPKCTRNYQKVTLGERYFE